MTETEIQQEIRLDLGREPDLVLWRNTGGFARHQASGTAQRFGLCKGAADLIGICRGRFVALEVKTPTGRLSPEQRLFLDLVRRRGGFAAVVRSVDDARSAIDRARQGATE